MTRPAPIRQADLERVPIERQRAPHWPRLMRDDLAAVYLGISATTLRERGPKPKSVGRRVLWDIKDLDRWADRLDGQPLDEADESKEAAEIERRFLESRRGRNG